MIHEKFGIFLDFETDSVKAEADNPLHARVEQAVKRAEEVLVLLSGYGEGGKQIIANTDPEKQEENWTKMCGLILTLAQSKQASDDLNSFVPEIVGQIWSGLNQGGSRKSMTQIIQEHMFLMLQLGKILDIVMRFDEHKRRSCSISNDISYAKRQVQIRQKNKTGAVQDKYKEAVNIQTLERLSMFYINATPSLSNTISITRSSTNNPDVTAQQLELIVVFCKICKKILVSDELRGNFKKFGTIGMVQRIMVATALLYDHMSAAGIFCKESAITIKTIVEILQNEAGIKSTRSKSMGKKSPKNSPSTSPTNAVRSDRASYHELQLEAGNLLTFLKYSSKHLNDASTPKAIQNIFKTIV